MKTFHIGGRFGDTIFALWTMKSLGGGKLIVSNYHKGNWSLGHARNMSRFLVAQPYVNDLDITHYETRGPIDYDLQKAEDDYNPEDFGMTREDKWPGRANIARRYAIHFGFQFNGVPWLEPQGAQIENDVAFHCPMRRSVRSWQDWFGIVTMLADAGLSVAVLGDEPPLHNQTLPPEWDLFDTLNVIARSKVFLGTVSCCNAIAEGLGKPRLVEQAEDCFNVNPTVSLNGMSNDAVVEEVKKYL